MEIDDLGDDECDYMNPHQLAYFKALLLSQKKELEEEAASELSYLQDDVMRQPDALDCAATEVASEFHIRTRDRCKKLITKIDYALARIEDGSYGYCLETGAPIGIARLKARPVATLCVEAQAKREKFERQHIED